MGKILNNISKKMNDVTFSWVILGSLTLLIAGACYLPILIGVWAFCTVTLILIGLSSFRRSI
jgi:hypothetical protein